MEEKKKNVQLQLDKGDIQILFCGILAVITEMLAVNKRACTVADEESTDVIAATTQAIHKARGLTKQFESVFNLKVLDEGHQDILEITDNFLEHCYDPTDYADE